MAEVGFPKLPPGFCSHEIQLNIYVDDEGGDAVAADPILASNLPDRLMEGSGNSGLLSYCEELVRRAWHAQTVLLWLGHGQVWANDSYK